MLFLQVMNIRSDVLRNGNNSDDHLNWGLLLTLCDLHIGRWLLYGVNRYFTCLSLFWPLMLSE